MAIEQSLYTQVIRFRRKALKFDAADENMEAEMKEMDEKLGKNAFSEDDNFDEAIPIHISKKKEQQKHTKRK